MAAIAILGIGNILLRDEGFGVRTVEYLERQYAFPENVILLDGGTLGMELLRFLKGIQRLIIVDAVSGAGDPGTLHVFRNEAVLAYFRQKVSMHELGIQDVLAALEVIEEPIRELSLFGFQTVALELGLEMSAEAEASVPCVAQQILEELQSWGVTPVERMQSV